MIYTHAAAALLGASIAAVGAYKVQDWRYTGQINQIKAAQPRPSTPPRARPAPRNPPVSKECKMPKPLPKPAPRWPAVMLTALVLSLTGCATTSAPPVAVCPANPPAPALSEPMPPVSYSLSAQELISAWRASLTATQTTPAR
jgi:hypothetical protein